MYLTGEDKSGTGLYLSRFPADMAASSLANLIARIKIICLTIFRARAPNTYVLINLSLRHSDVF